MSAQGLGVVLDPHRRSLGCAQGVDAEQVREGAVVDTERLGHLEEPDQLEPVQALGAGLVTMDLRQPCVDGGVGRDEAVDVREPEEPSDRVHHGDDRGVHQPGRPSWRMYSSTWARWMPTNGSSPFISHHANHRLSW